MFRTHFCWTPERSLVSCPVAFSRLFPNFFATAPRIRKVHGIAGRDVEITGPYHSPVELSSCTLSTLWIHRFHV